MHSLRPNDLTILASGVEEAYRFPETPTITISLGTTAAGTNMTMTWHRPTRSTMISSNWGWYSHRDERHQSKQADLRYQRPAGG